MRRVELRLREIRKQAVVAAVPVHDDDLLAAIPGHFVGRLLQQFELQPPAVGHRARLLFRFGDLAEIVLRKYDRVFLLGGIEGDVPHVEQIVAQWEMRPMLLHDAEGQQARALRPGDAVLEFGRRQLLPMHRELGLCRRLRPHDRGAEHVEGKQQWFVHVASRLKSHQGVARAPALGIG